MAAVRPNDLERLRDALARHDVEYLFLGKMAAILQGYPDTTQDADLFVEKTRFEDARRRAREIDGFRVCSMRDVIESKAQSNRDKDRESLPRLRDFATYLEREPRPDLRPLSPRRRTTSTP